MFNINNGDKSKLNLLWSIFVLFYSSFVCMSAYANVYFKTICECIRQKIFMCPRSIAAVPFDSVRRFRATLLLRTTVCVTEVIELLAVWRYYKPKTKTLPSRVHNSLTVEWALQSENPNTPPWQAFKMTLVVPSFITLPHPRCSPPPLLAKASWLAHKLAPPWLHS